MIKAFALISFFLLSVASSQEDASKHDLVQIQPEKNLRRQQRYVSQVNGDPEFWARELKQSSGNKTTKAKKAKDNKHDTKHKKSKKHKDSKSYKYRRDLQKDVRKDINGMDNFWERELKMSGKKYKKSSKQSKNSKHKKAKKSEKSYKYARRDLENKELEEEYVNYWDRDFSDIEENESKSIDSSVDNAESLQFWERELEKSSGKKYMKGSKTNKDSKHNKSKKAKKGEKSYKYNRRNEEVNESDVKSFWERELVKSSNRNVGKNAKHSKGSKGAKANKAKKTKKGKSYTYKRRLMTNEEQYVSPHGYAPSSKAIIDDRLDDLQRNVRKR